MSAKDMMKRMILFEETWSRMCPHKRFCGLTLDELRTFIRPALKAREEIEELENRVRAALAKRHDADTAARTPRGDAWRVQRVGAARAAGIRERKEDAIARAKELATRGALGQVRVHRRGGEIQSEWTYGQDPRRTRG